NEPSCLFGTYSDALRRGPQFRNIVQQVTPPSSGAKLDKQVCGDLHPALLCSELAELCCASAIARHGLELAQLAAQQLDAELGEGEWCWAKSFFMDAAAPIGLIGDVGNCELRRSCQERCVGGPGPAVMDRPSHTGIQPSMGNVAGSEDVVAVRSREVGAEEDEALAGGSRCGRGDFANPLWLHH